MATTPKPLYHGQPSSSAAVVYTAPTVCVVRHIRCANKDTTASYDLELWRNGSADANALIAKKTIPAGGEWEDDCYIPLGSGDTIYAKASTSAKLTVFIGGAEIA